MTTLAQALASAPATQPVFMRAGAVVTAGAIRAAAVQAAGRFAAVEGPLFLYTGSAAACAAGLLAAILLRRELCVLPQMQPAYLGEIGATPDRLLTDAGEHPTLTVTDGDAALAIDTAFDLPLRFYTSGSTGAPKEVPKSLSQIELEAASWVKWFGGRVDHFAGTVPHQHIYGMIFRLGVPVLGGWTSEDAQAFTWESFAGQLGPRSVGVTSPAHLTRMPPGIGGHPAFLLSSGGPLPLAGAVDAAAAFGAPPLEILGSTETGGVAIRQRSDDAEPWTPLQQVALQLSEEGVLRVRSPFAGDDAWTQMGDRAEVLPDGRFRLLARVDRVVKIEGKRVSLSRVEAALTALDEIAEAAVLPLGGDEDGQRLGAAIVLAEPGRRELARLGAFRFSRALRVKLGDALEPAERPKRWRFVGRLPQNAQGKRTAADLTALFDTTPILPTLDATVSADDLQAEIAFMLKPDLAFFAGHFPGRPILAGVVQVHLAARLAEEIWGVTPPSHEVSRMKFRKVLQAGQPVVLVLKRDAETQRIAFSWSRHGAPVSEGVIG